MRNIPGATRQKAQKGTRPQEVYITQVHQEDEGRVTKKLSKEFSGTESRILGTQTRFC